MFIEKSTVYTIKNSELLTQFSTAIGMLNEIIEWSTAQDLVDISGITHQRADEIISFSEGHHELMKKIENDFNNINDNESTLIRFDDL